MKKVIVILLSVIIVGMVVLTSIFLAQSNSVESIAISGDLQTLYFIDESVDVKPGSAKLQVTYKNKIVKYVDFSDKNIEVKNFTTSVVNNGKMKILYKSETIEVPYSVIYCGLYYLSDSTKYSFNGGSLVPVVSGPYSVGVDNQNIDKTTATQMIYFYNDGACDYYSRANSTADWYVDDGHNNNEFNYKIVGSNLHVNLGKNLSFDINASFSQYSNLVLNSRKDELYDADTRFIKSSTFYTFKHYEMKTNRTFYSNNISIISDKPIFFNVGQTYEESGNNIYLKINYVNDSFLKTVYVRFNTSMINSSKGFKTDSVVISAKAECFYKGVNFLITYSVD